MAIMLSPIAASELNKVFDLPLDKQNVSYMEFKLKYRAVSSGCGMKMTLVDGSIILLDEKSGLWGVEIEETA